MNLKKLGKKHASLHWVNVGDAKKSFLSFASDEPRKNVNIAKNKIVIKFFRAHGFRETALPTKHFTPGVCTIKLFKTVIDSVP
jgi:hypothetical protein